MSASDCRQVFPPQILPPSVAIRSAATGSESEGLFPIERSAVERAVPRRIAQFTAGRMCARDALAALGGAPCAIPVGTKREPVWPDGFVGSITHTEGCVAAAVASRSALSTIGIDAELATPLRPDLIELILSESERAELETHADGHDLGIWSKIAFSAKESLYKAYYPVTRSWLDFHDVRVQFDRDAGSFRAELVAPDRPSLLGLRTITGRFLRGERHVFTVVAVASGGRVSDDKAPREGSTDPTLA